MVSATNIALTGLNAASLKTSVAADDIANARSTASDDGQGGPYIPKDIIQVPLNLGGTQATVVESDKKPIKLFEPTNIDGSDSGFVKYPNVDISEELVKQSDAIFQYKSNLNVIAKDKEMHEFLLDIFA